MGGKFDDPLSCSRINNRCSVMGLLDIFLFPISLELMHNVSTSCDNAYHGLTAIFFFVGRDYGGLGGPHSRSGDRVNKFLIECNVLPVPRT